MSDGYRADCIREHEQIQKQLCKIEHDKGHPEGQCEHCRQELTSLRAQLAEANERVKYLEAGMYKLTGEIARLRREDVRENSDVP